MLSGATALLAIISYLLLHSVKLPVASIVTQVSVSFSRHWIQQGPQPTYITPKDQSILTTAPKALLVDDKFVDFCCSHLVLLFPSAVPRLGERSHLASLSLKHKKARMSDFSLRLLFDFRPVSIYRYCSDERVAPALGCKHSLDYKED